MDTFEATMCCAWLKWWSIVEAKHHLFIKTEGVVICDRPLCLFRIEVVFAGYWMGAKLSLMNGKQMNSPECQYCQE